MLGVRDINFQMKYKLIIDIVKNFGWDAFIFEPNNFDICLEKKNSIGRGIKKKKFNWGGGWLFKQLIQSIIE